MIRLSALIIVLSLMIPDSAHGPGEQLSLIYFSGSDWCTECILFDRKVLGDTAFTNYLNRHHIVLEQIDFPQRKKLTKQQMSHNKRVADRYSFDGTFPTLLLGRTDTLHYVKLKYYNEPASYLIREINNNLNLLQ